MWLLDTNVISELRKPRPDQNVAAWIASERSERLLTSVVCLAEINAGIEALENIADRQRLQSWYEAVVGQMFQGRTIEISLGILSTWLRLIKFMHAKRLNAPPVDLLVAATSLDLKIPIVTRDFRPFVDAGVAVLNPWTGERFNGA